MVMKLLNKHNINSNYFKATGLYTIGNFFNKAVSLLLLPIFTRLLSTSSYGVVSTYLSWVNIFVIIIGAELNLTLRSAYSDYKNELNSYIYSINYLTTVIFFATLTITLIITKIFFSKQIAVLSFFCLYQAYLSAIINVELQKQMMALEYVKRTVLLILPNLISALLGVAIILIWPSTDYMGRIITMVFVYTIIGGYLLIKYWKNRKLKNTYRYWKYALSYSLPLIFHGLAGVLLNNIDKTMVTTLRSAEETGIYSVAYTMGMALIAVTSALESVWIPWFTKMMNLGKKEAVNQIGSLYIYSGTFVCVAAMMCLPEILKLFSEKSYWDAIYILPPIVLASFIVFLFTISANIEYYYKSTKQIATNTIVATVLNIILNYIFIPSYGAIAAAYTTVVSYIVSFILHYLHARKLDKSIFNTKMYCIPLVLVTISTIITYFLINNAIARWIIALTSMIVFAAILMRNKDNLKN